MMHALTSLAVAAVAWVCFSSLNINLHGRSRRGGKSGAKRPKVTDDDDGLVLMD